MTSYPTQVAGTTALTGVDEPRLVIGLLLILPL